MAENVDQNATTDESVKPKKRGKLLIIIVLLVVLLSGGGGGAYFWIRSARAQAVAAAKTVAETKDENASAKKEAGDKFSLPEDDEVKKVVELQPFIVNLADAETARYLRMSVSVGIGEDGDEKPDPLFLTRVKNAMLSVLTTKRSSDVLSIEGKQKLREELLQAAQAASTKPKVQAVYITDFIVQL